MRGRLSFALTACTLLFLLEGLAALLATGFTIIGDATRPDGAPAALLLLVLPLLALCSPIVPVTRLFGRYSAVAGTAILAAVARVPLSMPQLEYRLVAACVVVAAGASFLSCAVGFLERRSVAAGVGAAIVLDQLLRLAGWSWSIGLRPWWLLPQLVISAVVIVLAASWLRMPPPDDASEEPSFERRGGGLRLRGGLALAIILFIDLNVLARPEVAARWLGARYEAAAVLLVAAGTAATLVLLAGHGPLGRYRMASVLLAALAGAAAVAVMTGADIHPWVGVLLMAGGHAAAVLLIGRALVPASGRRKGGTTAAALCVWFGCTVLYAATFFAPADRGPLAGAAPALFATTSVLLVLLLVLLPRPVMTLPPLRHGLYVSLSLIAAVSMAALLAVRERPSRPDAQPGDEIRVATYDVRLGFDDDGRYDPGRIMRAIRAADSDVLVLQGVPAALPAAYGTDVGLYLSRRLGFRLFFAPHRNGLLGDAVLSRVGVAGFSVRPAAHASAASGSAASGSAAVGGAAVGGAAVGLVTFMVPAGSDTLHVIFAHFTHSADRQADAVLEASAAMAGAAPVVLVVLGTGESRAAVLARLRAAGFNDARADDVGSDDAGSDDAGFDDAGFDDAGSGDAGSDARRPVRTPSHGRPDGWILTRNVTVRGTAVSTAGGAGHRLLVTTVRLSP